MGKKHKKDSQRNANEPKNKKESARFYTYKFEIIAWWMNVNAVFLGHSRSGVDCSPTNGLLVVRPVETWQLEKLS